MNRFDLGVGLALMPGLADQIDAVTDLVDCLEVEPQTFWLETGDPTEPFRLERAELQSVVNRFDSLLAHGVTTPVGGTRQPDPFLVHLFSETVSGIGAKLASEHLSFNESTLDGIPFTSAFFLPPRQTWAGVDAAVASVNVLRKPLMMPFSVETPVSYLQPRSDEIDDGAFMAAVATQADCGILLDLHNIWTNERNGRQSARDYVSQLPLDRVWEVHLAGGLERRGYWLDAHSGALDPGLLALAAEVLPMLPAVRAVVYEILPEFLIHDGRNVLRADLEAVHRLVEASRSRSFQTNTCARTSPQTVTRQSDRDLLSCDSSDPSIWEQTVALLAIGRNPRSQAVMDGLSDDPGMDLIQELVGAGRNGRVASSTPLTIELLTVLYGIDGVTKLLDEYSASTVPGLWGSQEGRQFAGWVVDAFRDHRLIPAAVSLDLAALDAAMSPSGSADVELPFDPLAFIAMIRSGTTADLPVGRYLATVGA
jgi:uncharacterized protein